jgi:adenosine deaminase
MNPTVELHRHFEAGLAPETIARLAERRSVTEVRTRAGQAVPGVDPQDPVSIRAYYSAIGAGFTGPGGFAAFADSFGLPLSVLQTLEDLEQAVFEQVVSCAEQGSLHTELRGSPFTYQERIGASVDEIAGALVAGVDRAWTERSLSATFVLAFSRQKGLAPPDAPPAQRQAPIVAALAASLHRPDRPVGLDVAGFPETPYPPRMFQEALRPAHDAGVPLTVHAGEQGRPPDFADAPPSIVVEAVESLGARRIGHGTSLAVSARAREVLRQCQAAIECCPVSNARMGFVPLERHPLPLFLREGLLVSLSTDDPLMFGPSSVRDTFGAIAGPLVLTDADFRQLTLNAIDSAFVTDDRRRLLRDRFERCSSDAQTA